MPNCADTQIGLLLLRPLGAVLLLLPGNLLLLLLLLLCYSLILKSTPSMSFTCRQHSTAQHGTGRGALVRRHTLWSPACLRDISQAKAVLHA